MLALLILNSVTGVIILVFGTAFYYLTGQIGTVTSLPYGLDAGFVTFMKVINGALASMPWLVVPAKLIFIAIQIKVFLVVVDLIRWVFSLIRG